MPSQVARVVEHADASCNTELEVVSALSSAAARRTHGVVLMVELGDLREGIMSGNFEHAARHLTLGICPNWRSSPSRSRRRSA